MGQVPDWVPCHQSVIAHRRNAADLDYLEKVVHSWGIFGGGDLRRSSGERGVGGLDCAAKKHDGNAILPVVDIVLFEDGDAVAAAKPHYPPWDRSLVLFKLICVCISDAQQGIGCGSAGDVVGDRLVAASFD